MTLAKYDQCQTVKIISWSFMKISRKLELLPQDLFIDVEYKSRKWGSSYYFNSIDTPLPPSAEHIHGHSAGCNGGLIMTLMIWRYIIDKGDKNNILKVFWKYNENGKRHCGWRVAALYHSSNIKLMGAVPLSVFNRFSWNFQYIYYYGLWNQFQSSPATILWDFETTNIMLLKAFITGNHEHNSTCT